MEEVTGEFNIGLHARGCTCERCQPWIRGKTTLGNFPTKILYISKKTWENSGFPATIEEFYKNCADINPSKTSPYLRDCINLQDLVKL